MTTTLETPPTSAADRMELAYFLRLIRSVAGMAPKRLATDEATALVQRAVMDLEGIAADLGRFGK